MSTWHTLAGSGWTAFGGERGEAETFSSTRRRLGLTTRTSPTPVGSLLQLIQKRGRTTNAICDGSRPDALCAASFARLRRIAPMGKLIARVLMIYAAALLSGCVGPLQTDENFPRDWPPILSLGPECDALNGTYENRGRAAEDAKPPMDALLSDLLVFYLPARRALAQSALVSLKLEMSTWVSASASLHVSDGDHQAELAGACGNGTLLVLVENSNFGGVFASSISALLTRANDGSLIVKEEEEGGDLFVPASGRTTWARFSASR